MLLWISILDSTYKARKQWRVSCKKAKQTDTALRTGQALFLFEKSFSTSYIKGRYAHS